MKNYPVIIEKDADTGLLVGYIPNVVGAHSQGKTLEELRTNLREVIDMLLEDVAKPTHLGVARWYKLLSNKPVSKMLKKF